MQPSLVLGSGSPRRAQLLRQLGVSFSVCSADIDETPLAGEPPDDYVRRMAREKGEEILDSTTLDTQLLLTADTTVVLDGESLGKPEDHAHGFSMLSALSGRQHDVLTAVSLRSSDHYNEVLVTTRVEFDAITPALINAYLQTSEPWDKAGAYAIQGLAGSFVKGIVGSVSNVVGLPQVETRKLLAGAGIITGVENRHGNQPGTERDAQCQNPQTC